jgi:hypothetical protein
LSYLIGKRHHAALLQADWQFYGAESFAWWATYSISDKEALEDEKRLVMLANAFEDFGGYCQRTNGNCIGACIRDTELKLMRSGLFEYLPTTRVEARFSDVWIKTFCQGNTLLAQSLRHACRFAKGKRAQAARERQLAAWKSTSTMHVSASKRGVSECR